jgi:hypothetical protein
MTRLLLLAAAALALSGCAELMAPPEEPLPPVVVVVMPEAPSARTAEASPDVPLAAAPPPQRPRLSQTVTLGKENQDATYTAERPSSAAPRDGAAANVTVNNQVIVHQAPGFLPFGYGFGAEPALAGYAPRGDGFGKSAGGSWGASGFEGPARTAAPGQTPAVGGNWPSAPSYGPRSMR